MGGNTDCDDFLCSGSMIPVRVGGSFLYEENAKFLPFDKQKWFV